MHAGAGAGARGCRGRGLGFDSKVRRTRGKQKGSCSLHFSLGPELGFFSPHALPASTSVSPPSAASHMCKRNSNTITEEADSYTFTSLLRLCTHRRSGTDGRVVHALLLTCLSPILTNVYVGTALVNMYSKCGMFEDAYNTFVRMPHATVFTWNTIILACIHAGQTPRAIWLYITMISEGCTTPDEVTLINIIRVFTSARDAKHGALVFAQLVMDGFTITIPLGNTLLDMYIKCERIEDAVGLFEQVMSSRDVISWTHMITAHISHKDALAALGYFFRLLVNGLEPDEMTFAAVLHACAMLGDRKSGREAHSHMLEIVNGMNLFIGDTLVDMYAKCGSIKDAEKVFYNLSTRSIVSWNSLLTGYVNREHIREAFNLFCKMQCEDVEANAITFVTILNACIVAEDVEFGMAVHACAAETEFQSLTIVGNALTNMYINCKSILDAQKVFLEMGEHSVVSWNTMISGLTKHGHALYAIDLFKRMQYSSVTPDAVTYVSVLSAISSTQNLYEGWIIHSDIIEMGFQLNSFIENALIDMYSKCRSLNDAWQVFNNMSSRDIVSWNAILSGFSIEELHEEVMELFFNMKSEGMDPDHITFVRALNGCASIGCLDRGHLAHALAIEYGYDEDVFISTNLIDMYIKAQSLESAQRVFDKTSNQDIVSWTLILAAYIDNGQENCAFKIFCQLVKQNFRQDEFTFMNALNACAGLAAIEKGKMVHTLIVELGFEESNLVCNALIDMYSKSGSTVDAQRVLDAMQAPNVVSWNAMISGYAEHGQGETALQLVNQMQLKGISLNHISSLGVLSACSHAGLMVEGYGHLKSMNRAHGTTATMEHYACMIDLLGRTGHLEEALGLINKLPVEPSVHVWKALLRASHIHHNLALGKMAAERVLKHDPSSATTYVMLSNIYGSLGMWNDHAQVIRTMKSRGIQKQPGCSYIEIDKQVYSFVANDTSHPQTKEIYATLDLLFEDLKVEGYEPDTSFVRYDVNEDEKELILRHHSEKLAIAFGLIKTPPQTPLCIIKNLRICGDCHTASKFISKTMKREIILRDNVRFHHIKHGVCSCGDYW